MPLGALNLDCAELSGAALCQARGADIAGHHVRVTVYTLRLHRVGILGIVPRAGRQLDDSGSQRLAQHRAGEAGSAVVVKAHDVALRDAACRGILRMDADRPAPPSLSAQTVA